jgi:hypothetical protein
VTGEEVTLQNIIKRESFGSKYVKVLTNNTAHKAQPVENNFYWKSTH